MLPQDEGFVLAAGELSSSLSAMLNAGTFNGIVPGAVLRAGI
jgi:hypothetical protein